MTNGAKKRTNPYFDAKNLSAEDVDAQLSSDKHTKKSAGGDGDPPSDNRDDAARKFRAKRHNEHVKALYSLTNTLGAAILGAAYILPEIQGVKVIQEADRPTWVVIGLVVIASGHAAIRWGTRRED